MTNLLRAGVVLFFLSLAVWAITLNHHDRVIAHSEPWLWLTTALVSVGPELAGIVIGVVTIDYLNERRQDEQLKGQLILQLGSKHNDVTDTALRVLTARGWLYDGSLSDAFLVTANLSGAELEGADLSGANLWRANLSESHFREANLSRAHLPEAYLVGTSLWGADLSGAYLQGANLTRATLPLANLSGANLWRVNLSGANLLGADLSGVSFWAANLSMASLSEANLSGATEWTIRQIKSVETLKGAIMPDGVQLTGEYIEGTILEEWETDYLARHGGTETDIRDRMYDT